MIDKESDAVRLVHYTAQEYFESYPLWPRTVTEERISRACIAYLSLDCFGEGPCADNKTLKRRFKKYPFLRYATLNWGNHARGPPEDSCKDLILRFLSDDGKRASAQQASSVRGIEPSTAAFIRWSQEYRSNVSMLSTASAFGLLKIVKHLIQEGHNVESADNTGTTALSWAAAKGHVQTIETLLATGADITRTDVQGRTPLIEAAANGHSEAVKTLVKHGAELESYTVHGDTALYFAVGSTDKSTVMLLLERGANVEAKCGIFEAAFRTGDSAMIELIKKNLDLSKRRSDIKSALVVHMESSRYPKMATVETLLAQGADLSYTSEMGETPLHLAAWHGSAEVVNLLLEHGANPNMKDEKGMTPLHWAAFKGSLESVELLLRKKAAVTAQNNEGDTVLHCCLHHTPDMDTVNYLLEQGALIDAVNSDGQSAMHEAARRGFGDLVDVLMYHGADVNVRDKQGRTPLQDAAASGKAGVVGQLLKRSPILGEPSHESLIKSASLRNAIAMKDNLLAEQMLEIHGIDVDVPDYEGRTALHHAAYNGLEGVVKVLVDRGASINARIADSAYENRVNYVGHIPTEAYECAWITPLHNAAGNGHADIAELLIAHGADITAAGRKGYKPYDVAISGGNVEVVKVLLKHGAPVNEPATPDSPSPLYWAVQDGCEELVRVLLEHGADEERHTPMIKRALALAIEFRHIEVVELLKSYGFTTAQS